MFFVLIEYFLYMVNSIIALLFYKSNKNEYTKDISIVLTLYKESEDIIKRSIESIKAQDYKGKIYKYLIIDGVEETYNIAKKYADEDTVVINKEKNSGKSNSLNIGLFKVKTEVAIFIDGDSVADKEMVKNTVREFCDSEVIGVGGHIVPLKTDNILSKLQHIEYCLSIQLLRSGNSVLNNLNIISGAFSAFRIEYLKRIGGWIKGSGEDLEVTLRLKMEYPNKKFKQASNAILYTDVPSNYKALIKQRIRWDASFVYIFNKYGFKLHKMNIINFIYFLLYNLYLCLISPIMILMYMCFMWYHLTLSEFINSFILIHLIYVSLTFIMYLLYLIKFKNKDYNFIFYSFIYPVYKLVFCFVTFIAFIYELLLTNNKIKWS